MAARRLVPRALHAAALAGAFTAGGVNAAADDMNAAPPVAAPTPSAVATFAGQLVDGMLATERRVADALAAGATTAASSATWHLGLRALSDAPAAAFPLGARWRALQGDADTHVPCVAWMADVQPVIGTSFLHGDALRPSLHLSAEWALGGDVSFGVMPGVAMERDAQGRRSLDGTLAVVLGKEWAPGWSTFVDIARNRLRLEQGGGVATTLDAGVSIATGASTQLDVALAHGLTAAAPAFQAGVGVSSSF